jgi:hypothetical protein
MDWPKKAMWIVIVVALAVGAWFLWDYYTLAIREPAIRAQVFALLDEKKGAGVASMPIPLRIGGEKFNSVDLDSVASALKKAGFVADDPPWQSFDVPDMGKGCKMNAKLYACEKTGVKAVTAVIGSKTCAVKAVTFSTDDALAATLSIIPNVSNKGLKSEKRYGVSKSDKSNSVGIGPLVLGLSESRVRRAVGRIPHDTRDGPQYRFVGAHIFIERNPEKIVNVALQMCLDKKTGMYLARGKYDYVLLFSDKRLASIIVLDCSATFRGTKDPSHLNEVGLGGYFDKHNVK